MKKLFKGVSFILILFIFLFIISNKYQKKASITINKKQVLTENCLGYKYVDVCIVDSDITKFTDTADPKIVGEVSGKSYEYHIKDGTLKIDSSLYRVEIADDGVLLIYDSSNTVIAQSKVALSTSNKFVYGSTKDGVYIEYKESDVEYFKRTGNGNQVTSYDFDSDTQSALREYAKANITKYNQYGNDSFTKEDYKYIFFEKNAADNENYMGVDVVEFNATYRKKYEDDFKDIIYDISMKSVYLLDRQVHNYPTNKVVELYPNGKYLVNADYKRGYTSLFDSATTGGSGIIVPSGVTLDLNGSTIKQILDSRNNNTSSNSENRYKVIKIISGDNITITNGTLVGDRSEKSTSLNSEFGTGIYVFADNDVNNLTISNMVLKYFSGDGIDVLKAPRTEGYVYVDLNINNNYIYANTRQGISLELVDKAIISDNIIYNIIGSLPAACIDIEPKAIFFDYKYDELNAHGNKSYLQQSYVDNVTIENNILNNFRVIEMSNTTKDIDIKNNIMLGRIGFYNCDGVLNLDGNIIKKNKYVDVAKKCENGVCLKMRLNHNFENAVETNVLILGLINKSYPNADKYDNIPSNKKAIVNFWRVNKNLIDLDLSSPDYYLPDNPDYSASSKVRSSNNTGTSASSISTNYNEAEYKYIKITRSADRQIYWLSENQKSTSFDPTGMKVELWDFVVSSAERKKIADVEFIEENGVKKVEIGGVVKELSEDNDNGKYVSDYVSIEGKEYRVLVDKKIEFSDPGATLMEKIALESKDGKETYEDWRTVKILIATLAQSANANSSHIELKNKLNIGEDISNSLTVYSNYYLSDKDLKQDDHLTKDKYIYKIDGTNYKFPNANVPEKYVTYEIDGKTSNKTILEASDIKNGTVTIVANYLGLTLRQTFNVDEIITEDTNTEKGTNSSNDGLTVLSPDTGISFNIKTIFVALLFVALGTFIIIKKRLKS